MSQGMLLTNQTRTSNNRSSKPKNSTNKRIAIRAPQTADEGVKEPDSRDRQPNLFTSQIENLGWEESQPTDFHPTQKEGRL